MDGERLSRRPGRAGQQVAEPQRAVEPLGGPDSQPGRRCWSASLSSVGGALASQIEQKGEGESREAGGRAAPMPAADVRGETPPPRRSRNRAGRPGATVRRRKLEELTIADRPSAGCNRTRIRVLFDLTNLSVRKDRDRHGDRPSNPRVFRNDQRTGRQDRRPDPESRPRN